MKPSGGRGERAQGGVFFLHGEDEFRKEVEARRLVSLHLDPATRDFNFDLLRGSEVGVETLASTLSTPPMMADWRVVLLRETEALASSPRARDILVDTARRPPPGLALILLTTVPRGSSAKLYGELKRHARSVEFGAVSPNDVPAWLMEWARDHHGREMTLDAARALGAAVGTELGVLAQEVDKLVSLVPEGEAINREAVEAAGTHLASEDRWAWMDSVGEKKLDRALQGLELLMAQGESGVGLVIGLTTHLLRLGAARTGGKAAAESALGNMRPGAKGWIADKLVKQARLWGPGELDDALLGLRRADRLLKSTSLSDAHVLEEWILGLMARGKRGAA